MQFTRLYKLHPELTHEELCICARSGIKPGEIMWCDSNRPSSLGGYIGNFRHAAAHDPKLGLLPIGATIHNIPMRFFSEVIQLKGQRA